MIIKVLIACAALAAPCSALAVAPEPVQEGLTVVRDPQTGKLRAPTPAEQRALRPPPAPEKTMAPVQKPTSTVRPDGTRAINLGERGLVYSVVKRNPDGSLSGHCVKGEHEASNAVNGKQEVPHDHH